MTRKITFKTTILSVRPLIFSVRLSILSLGLLLALSGCMGMGVSAEAVAFQEARNYNMPDFRIDPATIQVLQQQPVGDAQIVLVAFQGVRQGSGKESCLFSFEVHKSRFGAWAAGGGGGGCSNQALNPEKEPLSVGGSSGSSDAPGDPGYSSSSGQVFRDDIQHVRVTWIDGMEQEVAVINRSFLATRTGLFETQKVEALDADKNVIDTNQPQVDPAKQQLDSTANP